MSLESDKLSLLTATTRPDSNSTRRGLSFGSAREEEGGAVGGGYGGGDGDWERDNGVGGGEFGIFWF
ncbi:unnamed protein product [Prunus armeniaca]